MIRTCVAVVNHTKENPEGEKCGNECEPGFKYCEEHKDRKKAVEERQKASLKVLNGGATEQTRTDIPYTSFDDLPESGFEDAKSREVVVETRTRGQMATASPRNVVDQVSQMLERVYGFTSDAFKAYQAIELEDWSFTDKAGTAQLRPEVSVYERALDRETRVIPQIAKLGMDQQAAIIEKAQFEGIKAAMTRTFIRMGMNQKQIDQANQIIAEEFSRMTG